MKYYSQYIHYELFDLQESLSVLSKSNRDCKIYIQPRIEK